MRRDRWLAAIGLAILLGTSGAILGPGGAGAAADGQLVARPVLGAPAQTFLGASPNEAPGEVWATAVAGSGRLARFTEAQGWETLPVPIGPEGTPASGLSFVEGPAAGRTTAAGGVAAFVTAGSQKALVIRDPGGLPRVAPNPEDEPVAEEEAAEPEEEVAEPVEEEVTEPVEEEMVLGPGESLFGSPPRVAAVEEPDGTTGAYVVPTKEIEEKVAAPEWVLGFDGHTWSRERICIAPPKVAGEKECGTKPKTAFRVLAIEAGVGTEGWMLAHNGEAGTAIELFRHEADGEWLRQSLGTSAPGSLLARTSPGGGVSVVAHAGQPLTVTSQGVWVDVSLKVGATASDGTFFYEPSSHTVTASWCEVTTLAGLCTKPFGQELPTGEYRSFAWPGPGFGQRVITGVGQGAILELEGEGFRRIPLAGGRSGTEFGAAVGSPDSGWLGSEGAPLRLGVEGVSAPPSNLQPWPVPFRRPLTAIASQPGAVPGALGAQALAVGAEGQVARYLPGRGWEAESLLNSIGQRVPANLRAVAWPTPGFAYAVGDESEMWMWRAGTGLWEPDPGKPPNLSGANFTSMAFDPSEPERGYAVGKQGLILGFGKEWVREELPPGVPSEANFTSVTFAGNEALAVYKVPEVSGHYTGGVLVNDGSGWQIEAGPAGGFGPFEYPQLVAGLPDGGAVIAEGRGGFLERNAPGAPWLPTVNGVGPPAALAVFREGGQLRALASVASPYTSGNPEQDDFLTDEAQAVNPPALGQPPLLTPPYPLPVSGVLVRQTAEGWEDEQHESLPPPERGNLTEADWPVSPDPILALLVGPEGSGGWAVGGVTGGEVSIASEGRQLETASVMRYGAGAAPPPNAGAAPIEVEAGTATFAVGGDARCAGPCADLVETGIGPQRWLKAAVRTVAAMGTAKVRAFLYSGPGVAEPKAGGSYGATLSPAAFAREEAAYAGRLGGEAGGMPVFAAPTGTDLNREKSLTTFLSSFAGFGEPFGRGLPGVGVSPEESTLSGLGYYSFLSSGGGGPSVRVVVLNYSGTTLETSSRGQQCWLASELAAARTAGTPAIVMGERDLAGLAPNAAADATEVRRILVGGALPSGCHLPEGEVPGSASAYLFDYPEENREYQLSSGGASIPAFGSGTLGYVELPNALTNEFLGASGFMLVSVGAPNPATNVAPVHAHLTPNIGSLAMSATDGTFLRRSQVALFEGLARRPIAGDRCNGAVNEGPCRFDPDPYVPIPSECSGPNCASGLLPEYEFSSSRPDIADFVEVNPAAQNRRSVLVNAEGKPIPDPRSGLLCAFNAGTTTVTLKTGGLSYSIPVTVQKGSVQRPCGTVPLREAVGSETEPLPTEPLPKEPEPGSKQPEQPVPPPPPGHQSTPQAHAEQPGPPAHHPIPKPVKPVNEFQFFGHSSTLVPLPVILPGAPPAPAEPAPPTGTSPVTQPVTSPEPQEDEEPAVEHVQHMSAVRLAHRRSGLVVGQEASSHSGFGGVRLIPILVLLAALAGAASLPRRRPDVAPAHSRQRKNRP